MQTVFQQSQIRFELTPDLEIQRLIQSRFGHFSASISLDHFLDTETDVHATDLLECNSHGSKPLHEMSEPWRAICRRDIGGGEVATAIVFEPQEFQQTKIFPARLPTEGLKPDYVDLFTRKDAKQFLHLSAI